MIGSECYYWRSRIVNKPPFQKGRVEYHQDFSYWYRDGCVFPDMLSCLVAVTPSTIANGCIEMLRGSHNIGRLDLYGFEEGAEYPNPEYVQRIAERHKRVFCELNSGDGLFFHCNTLHGSGANTTGLPRIHIFNTYNAVHNEPLAQDGQSDILAGSQCYEPIERVSDNMIIFGDYRDVFNNQTFFPVEQSDQNPIGIFKRPAKLKLKT